MKNFVKGTEKFQRRSPYSKVVNEKLATLLKKDSISDDSL